MSSTPVHSHAFEEIYHELFSTFVLLLPLIQEGLMSALNESICIYVQEVLDKRLVKLVQEKCG